MRLLSGACVLLLHVLVALALLFHLQAKKGSAPDTRPMQLLYLKPDVAPAPKPVAPMKSLSPPSATLSAPPFSVAPSDARRSPAFETAAPPFPALGQPVPSAPKNPGDLFSDDKKEEFKRFFKQQASEDQRENAKAAGGKSTCDVFKKPGEENLPDLQASNGITKTFVPAFGIGTHTPDDGKSYMQACN
jgi:hypothetical protein